MVPLVEPGLRHSQSPASDRVRHVVAGPLVGDEHGQSHRVASFTHRTTDRLRTSRSIRSSAFSARNRASSARSSPLKPSLSPRLILSCLTQLARVPAWIPRSAATWAIGLLVSRTIRTAPSRNSRSNFRLFSGMTHDPHSPCLHDLGGSSARLDRDLRTPAGRLRALPHPHRSHPAGPAHLDRSPAVTDTPSS